MSGHSNIAGTSDTVDGLSPSTTYEYRARAYGDGFVYSEEWGNPSSSDSATTHTRPTAIPTLSPPSAPASISASATSKTNIDVSWSSVSGSSHYELQRSPNWTTVSGNISGTSYAVGNLTHSTTYKFRVRAHGDGITTAGWGNFSSEATATTFTPVPVPTLSPPPAPNVNSTSATSSSISVTWDKPAGVAKHSFGIYTDMWRSNETTAMSGTKPNLNPDTTYNLRLEAFGDGVTYAAKWSATRWFEVRTKPTVTPTSEATVLPPPPRPTGISTSATTSSITTTWSSQSGVSSYELQIDNSGWKGVTVSGTSGTARNLSPDTNYNLRLRGYGDGVTYRATWSDYATFSERTEPTVTPEPGSTPPAPSVSSTSATHNSITVSWNAIDGVSIYDFGILKSGWQDSLTGRTSGTKDNLEADTLYQLRLRALGDGSVGSYFGWGPYTTFSVRTKLPTPTLRPPPAPSNVRASFIPDPVGYGLELIWDALSGVAFYRVERGYENVSGTPVWPGGPDYVTENIKTAQHTETGLTCERDHIFRVSAKGDNKNTLRSLAPRRCWNDMCP